jgi:TolA-binding protein
MQNPTNAWIAFISLPLLLLFGCGPAQPSAQEQQQLQAGYKSYDGRDYDQAMAQADRYLTKHSTGKGSGEALYLRGRSLEARTAQDQTQAKQNLQAARAAYIQALEQKPSPKLESYILTSLGNVAYFQDDYATAIQQWSTASSKLDKNDIIKAWVLYRMGIAQQRLGQFPAADKTFVAVQQEFPATEPARRAKEHQGSRAFFVQLAAFTSTTSADSAANELRTKGVTPVRIKDPQGRQLIRVGPVANYAQAMTLKSRFGAKYPDAIVVP